MKKILLSYILILVALIPVNAQKREHRQGTSHTQWVKEMQAAKLEYIGKAIGLADDKKEQFNSTYKAMDSELESLRKDMKKMTDRIDDAKEVTDLEYEKAAESLFEIKGKENAVEMKYYKQFKDILTKQQLYKLKKAEFKWTRELMKHRKNKK